MESNIQSPPIFTIVSNSPGVTGETDSLLILINCMSFNFFSALIADRGTGFFKGLISDAQVVSPSDMIMIGDAKALKTKPGGAYEASLDPTQDPQWPSNRHNRHTDLMFCDGHAESPLRQNVIDPKNLNWRHRWNNDNQLHLELGSGWSVLASLERVLDPSY